MSMETTSKVKVIPKLVKLEKGLKLAESWVNNMSGSTMDESAEVELESRPARLGLGARVALKSYMGASADPVERKLRAKLEAEKRRAAKNIEESNSSDRNVGHAGDNDDDDDDDDDPESRSNAFTKKRPTFLASSLQAKKKQK